MAAQVSDEAFAQAANQMGAVTLDHLDAARQAQAEAAKKGSRPPLAEVLVQQGLLTAAMRESIEKRLAAQQGGLKTLGSHRLIRKLGEGGMGAVYLAEDTQAQRQVALKVLPQKYSADPEFLARFRREAKAAGKLNHPNIVAAYAVGEDLGHYYYSMEFCEGAPLDALLKRETMLSWDKAVDIVLQVARGLRHAHQHQLIHRDIKPANILLTNDGAAKILDLGLSKNIGESEQSFTTQTGAIMGTPHYISPEQARGDKGIDGRTDIYSLGATLYHLLTGQTPFQATTALAILNKHLTEQLPNPQDIVEEIPDGVVQLIQKMMAKEPDDRYADCAALIADLELVIDGKTPSSANIDVGKSSVAMARAARVPRAGRPPVRTAGVPPSKAKGRPTTGPQEPVASRQPARAAERPSQRESQSGKSKTALTIAGGVAALGALMFVFALSSGGGKQNTARTENPEARSANPETNSKPENQIPKPVAPALVAVATAADLPKEIALDLGGGVKMEMVLVPAGEFTMGDENTNGTPVHKVKITRPFYLGKYEVTQAQYEKVMGKNPSLFKWPDLPVEQVSWDDAKAFCKRFSDQTGKTLKLPTEAQWEYACRAGTTTEYNTGNGEAALDKAGWYNKNSDSKSHAGGQKAPNAWGLYDMHGNVWEWCEDWYDDKYYAASPPADPPGPDKGGSRVLRGASWYDAPGLCRFAQRFSNVPGHRAHNRGFRLLLEAPPSSAPVAVQPAPNLKPETAVNWIDLLPLAHPQDDRVKGRWAKKDEALASEVSAFANIQFPYRPPKEYDVRFEFTRVSGTSGVALLLPGLGRSFTWVMGGWGNTLSGFEMIGNKGIHDNSTRADIGIENGRRYEVKIQVRSTGLKAFLDGKLLSEWSGDFKELGIHPPWILKDGTLLGLGSDQCETLFHRVEVLEASGKGEFTRPNDAAAKAALAQQEKAWAVRNPKPSAGVDDAWIKSMQALPAEEQVKKVVEKLKELNPGYDGATSQTAIENGKVTGIGIHSTAVTNIGPLRALRDLRSAYLNRCRFSDLSPLQGLRLSYLNCEGVTTLSDLSPLSGMPLDAELHIHGTAVADLGPIRGAGVSILRISGTPAADLSPLKDTRVRFLHCDSQLAVRQAEALKSIKTLEQINSLPVAEFWKNYPETGAAQTGVAALPKEMSLDLGGGVKMEMVLVPAGEFVMGDDTGNADEKPAHKVRISQPFYIGKYEVTVAQFRRFAETAKFVTECERVGNKGTTVKDGKWQNNVEGINWKMPGFEQEENHPVVLVSWNDAQAFCKWANGLPLTPNPFPSRGEGNRAVRLPTEAEWEYAARGTENKKYAWGNTWDGALANHGDVTLKNAGFQGDCTNDNDGFANTSPVGNYKSASWCGAFDMAGNVSEWVNDKRQSDYYAKSPAIDPPGGDGRGRVFRGGSWNNALGDCRAAYRGNAWLPGDRFTNIGFRVVTPAAPGVATVIKPEPAVTFDLLALTDALKDRVVVPIPAFKGANTWERKGNALLYKSDGKAGKIAPPVNFAAARVYEMEIEFERLSGNGRIHMDLPLEDGRIVPLTLDWFGRKLIEELRGPAWPANTPKRTRFVVRVQRGKGNEPDVLNFRVNDTPLDEWKGRLTEVASRHEAHPEFPTQPVTSIFCFPDSYEIRFWQLRVYEGEAKVLRAAAQPETPGARTEYPFKNAKVGDWIEMKVTRRMVGKTSTGTSRQKVIQKSETEMTIEEIAVIDGRESKTTQKVDLTKPFNLLVGSSKDIKIKDLATGTENVTVAGKVLATTWTLSEVTAPRPGKTVTFQAKRWFSEVVPLGGGVASEMDIKDDGMQLSMQLIAYGFGTDAAAAGGDFPKEIALDLGGGVKMEMVLVKAGTFMMGSPENEAGREADKEGPQHEVAITKPFYMGKYEVTVAQFRAFAEATKYQTDAEKAGNKGYGWDNGWKELSNVNWKMPNFPQADYHPVCMISWNDAQAFCKWASGLPSPLTPLPKGEGNRTVRLPSEAEWEYACRARTTTRFYVGDQDKDLDKAGWFDGNSGRMTHPVGQKTPNAWGLYDMHGNVWEWCEDRAPVDYNKYTPRADPPGPVAGNDRVLRGGRWGGSPADCRSARRLWSGLGDRSTDYGFRAVAAVVSSRTP